jgi:hypothetical protein
MEGRWGRAIIKEQGRCDWSMWWELAVTPVADMDARWHAWAAAASGPDATGSGGREPLMSGLH